MTFDGKGELMLSIMSSLAQEESRSISDNVTWGQRKRFADGKVNMPYSQFLGYRKGKDGLPEIDPAEAETVRLIYQLYMSGKTCNHIATILTDMGIPTPSGKTTWHEPVIHSILTNERYKGEALLQKAYTVDFLTKKTKKNNGDVPQYYVKDSHPAIIDREEWALVQEEMARRKAIGHGLNSLSPFSMRIFCGECGRVYGSKVWHSTDQYRKIVWRCNGKYAGKHVCSTPYLNDKDIPVIFMRAISQLRDMWEILIADCEALLAALESTEKIDSKRERIVEERSVVEGLISKRTKQNEKKPIDPETYNSKLESYTQRYNDLSDKLDKIGEKYGRLEHEKAAISKFIDDLKTLEEMPVMFTPGL